MVIDFWIIFGMILSSICAFTLSVSLAENDKKLMIASLIVIIASWIPLTENEINSIEKPAKIFLCKTLPDGTPVIKDNGTLINLSYHIKTNVPDNSLILKYEWSKTFFVKSRHSKYKIMSQSDLLKINHLFENNLYNIKPYNNQVPIPSNNKLETFTPETYYHEKIKV